MVNDDKSKLLHHGCAFSMRIMRPCCQSMQSAWFLKLHVCPLADTVFHMVFHMHDFV